MTEDQGARYDRIAGGYARHWGPVIRPAAVRLLDEVDPRLGEGPLRLLDIGTGTGTLALAALERWPAARVSAIDASTEMLGWAERDADRRLDPADRARLDTAVAFADRLPFGDATFDLAVSSFVLQLVPSRAAALREARRILRPGGTMAFVTWLRGEDLDPPDRIFEEVLDEFGFDPPEPDGRTGDPANPRAAAASLRRAGFHEVRARAEILAHRWTARRYVDFLEHFAEESTFEDLSERERLALRRRLLERVGSLPPRDLRLRLPIVYVTGRAA